jgi:hypothetical protein
MAEYNEQRPHQGRWCFGKTPMQTFLDAKPIAKEKMIAAWQHQTGARQLSRHRRSDEVLAFTSHQSRIVLGASKYRGRTPNGV